MVWVTATAPYIVLTILLIRGVTLPGAAKGIYYYLTPDFSKLNDPKVWSAAASQIFFSLGPGFGVLLALSSYNDFNNNCYRDAIVTSSINCLTSFFSGFVIFSTLGYMAELTNKEVSEVVGDHDASADLIVYPKAQAGHFAGIEALITGLCDESRLLSRNRELFVGVDLRAVLFWQPSSYQLRRAVRYPFSRRVWCVAFSSIHSHLRNGGRLLVLRDRSVQQRYQIDAWLLSRIYWRVCWMMCPIFISIIFIMTVWQASLAPMQMPGYVFPKWSVGLGWFLRMLSVSSVPLFAIYMLSFAKGTFTEVSGIKCYTFVSFGNFQT
ncbi:Sodium:neurotransmitter symporter family protein [Ostertagia ostertagi]